MATYTKDQVIRYLTYINYPSFSATADFPSPTYETLRTLQQLQQAKLPFENLDLHYRKDKRVVVGHQETFEKTVGRAMGKGGYCHELNTLFATILRTLGFDVVTVGAKVCLGRPYLAWNHYAILATIDGRTYLTDTGFGANEPITPIPIDSTDPVKNLGSTEDRLVFQPIPGQKLPLHILQHRIDSKSEWIDSYAFSATTEFSEEDYQMMSYATSTIPGTLFTASVLAAKLVLEDGKPVARRTMLDARGVTENKGDGEPEKLVAEFKAEEERIDALEKYFDIRMTDEEKAGIVGDAAAIDAMAHDPRIEESIF